MRIKTVEAIKGQEEKVLHQYGLSVTGNRHIDCPICEKRKKFRINSHNGQVRYICVCGSGSVIDLIMEIKGLDYKTACKQVDQIIGNEYRPTATTEKPKLEKKALTFNRFQSLHRVKDTPIETYLNSRGIYELPELSVKYANAEWDGKYQRSFGCMYAVATNDNMDIGYSHKTYLENGKKADVEVNKKLETMNKLNEPCPTCHTNHAASVAIRMFPHDKVLGISEGIESALSAKQLYRVPTWAVLNTAIMKVFKAPLGVTELVIYADNDRNGAGLAAAFECAHKNLLSKNDVETVTIQYPEKTGTDFNDLLLSPGNTETIKLGV